MRAAFGASSLSNSKRLAPSSVMKRVTPVAFPPGWLRLDTSPMVTGSPPSVNTIGMAEVAAFAASAALLPPVAAITLPDVPRVRPRAPAAGLALGVVLEEPGLDKPRHEAFGVRRQDPQSVDLEQRR